MRIHTFSRGLSPLPAAVITVGMSACVAGARVPFDGAPDVELNGIPRVAALHAADFDLDGRNDLLALSSTNNRLTLFLNHDQGLVPVRELDAGASASGFAVADFNRDGKLDIAVSHHDSDEIWVFLALKPDAFDAPKTIRTAATKPHVHMVRADDVNKDGFPDLLLAQSDDNKVWVLVGDGKGGFQPSDGSPMAAGQHAYVVATGDFNGDGKIDIATPNWHGRSVSVFLGDGTGRFKDGPNSPVIGFPSPIALAAGDVTGDDRVDLVLGNDDSRKLVVLSGDGSGGFDRNVVPDLEARGDCIGPVLADINGDGKLDVLAAAMNGAATFSYWINRGAGQFNPPHALDCPGVASTPCVSDLNGDNVPDLATGAWRDAKIRIWFGKR